MTRHDRIRTGSMIAIAAALGSAASAQWPSDPAQNLCLSDRPGDQTQAKMAPTADGGCYVSWFDMADGAGYDVYLQRLDADGNELWPHNGVLVADRSFLGTQDYGLAIDASGNALLAFRDDRSGFDEITANKVSPDGTLLWGTGGVQLANGSVHFVASPDIAGTTDGEIVVAWGYDNDVQLQRLGADGLPVWASPITLTDPDGGVFWPGDLRASDGGSVIMALRRDGPMMWDPKHIWAQKFSPTGDPLWGATPLVVFDAGSMQFGNFPTFIPDGSGGAIFYWYVDAPTQCYAQHISAAGVELFGHNGSAAATLWPNTRSNPTVCYDPVADETIMFWVEHWTDPNFIEYWGVYGQKFDGAGARLWSDSGVILLPLETIERLHVQTLPCGDGAMVFWAEESGVTEYCLEGMRVDGTGDPLWSPTPLPVSARFTHKSKVAAMCNTDGVAFLAWTDGTLAEGDIFAQNVNTDGTLGPAASNPADVNGDGVVDVLDLLAVLSAWGPCAGCPEDINGDGVVDVVDLLELLAAWTP